MIAVTPKPDAFARLLCWTSHPIALWAGTVPPLVPCCADCQLFPPDRPATAWTWPG